MQRACTTRAQRRHHLAQDLFRGVQKLGICLEVLQRSWAGLVWIPAARTIVRSALLKVQLGETGRDKGRGEGHTTPARRMSSRAATRVPGCSCSSGSPAGGAGAGAAECFRFLPFFLPLFGMVVRLSDRDQTRRNISINAMPSVRLSGSFRDGVQRAVDS